MGLHNPNDPRYRTKRGNLFRTFLSSYEPDAGASVKRRGESKESKIARLLAQDRERATASRASARSARQRNPLDAVKARGKAQPRSAPAGPTIAELPKTLELANFLYANLALGDQVRFMKLVAAARRGALSDSGGNHFRTLAGLIDEATAEKYLGELRERKAAGRPFLK